MTEVFRPILGSTPTSSSLPSLEQSGHWYSAHRNWNRFHFLMKRPQNTFCFVVSFLSDRFECSKSFSSFYLAFFGLLRIYLSRQLPPGTMLSHLFFGHNRQAHTLFRIMKLNGGRWTKRCGERARVCVCVWRGVLWFFKLVACARQGLKIVMPEHKFILANPLPSHSHPPFGTDAYSIHLHGYRREREGG